MEELYGGALRSVDAGDSEPIVVVDSDSISELFVINLCAAMTPTTVAAKGLSGFEQYKLYQVSRIEDGRRRFRLRMGFFASESAAEIVLNTIRHSYPTAFTARLSEEDFRHAPEGHRGSNRIAVAVVNSPNASLVAIPAKAEISPTKAPAAARVANNSATLPVAASKPAPAREVTPASQATKPAAPPKPIEKKNQTEISLVNEPAITAATSVPAAATPHNAHKVVASTHSTAAINTASTKAAGIELAKEHDAARPASATATHDSAKPKAPFHVAAGIELPPTNLELAADAPASAPVKPVAKPPQQNAAMKSAHPSLLDKPRPSAPAPAIPPSARDVIPVLDSTQTIRTLSAAELSDANQPKWFVVQLAVSDQPVNLDTMPRLDIFAAFSLYSVAVMEEGKIRHALRLGFFKEEVSAEAVSGYLKTFFPQPKITRISAAEHKRFSEQPARTESPTPHNVVQLDQARDRTHKQPVTPPAPEASAGTSASGRFPTADNKVSAPNSVKTAARSVAPAVKRTVADPKKKPLDRKTTTGAHRSLGEQLRDEARQVALSASGITKQTARQGSLLSRLVDRLKN